VQKKISSPSLQTETKPVRQDEAIRYFSMRTHYGWITVTATDNGLCGLALADSSAEATATLHKEFSAARLRRDPSLGEWIEAALTCIDQGPLGKHSLPLLDLHGTAFQQSVWRAIGTIPRGETRSYSKLAASVGKPRAARAVARACAANRIALLIPCHRVVGSDGSLTGYRWGIERKRQLLMAEGCDSR